MSIIFDFATSTAAMSHISLMGFRRIAVPLKKPSGYPSSSTLLMLWLLSQPSELQALKDSNFSMPSRSR